MVTHMLLLDMVTHTLALDTVIPTLIHLTGTDMDIRTLPICVVIMGIPTAVISTTNVYKRFVFMLVQCVKCSLTFNIAHHYAVGFVFIISHDSLIIQVPSTSGAFSMHVHSPCMFILHACSFSMHVHSPCMFILHACCVQVGTGEFFMIGCCNFRGNQSHTEKRYRINYCILLS